MRGAVISGLGKGSKFMPIYAEKIQEAVGFLPADGTLNLRVDADQHKRLLNSIDAITIPSFTKDGNTYGSIHLYPITIDDIQAAIVRPEKTQHDNTTAEIVAPLNLREKLGLEDGDEVEVRSGEIPEKS